MNKYRVQELIDALRSGRYQQTTYRLRNGDTYCCLGVACDLYPYGSWDYVNDKSFEEFISYYIYFVPNESPQEFSLPPSVQEYYGFTHSQREELVSLNDDSGATFDHIADRLEEWKTNDKV